jgi:hypothetical protein
MLRRLFTAKAETSFKTKTQNWLDELRKNGKILKIAGNWLEIRTGGFSNTAQVLNIQKINYWAVTIHINNCANK